MAINFRVSGNNTVSFSSEPAGNPGAIGIRNHDELSNRDLADQHPISAITFLQEILEGLEGGKADNSDLVAESERAIDAEDEISQDVTSIQAVIPAQASEQNKLADKNFVNSSIATNTAYYISDDGQPFDSVEDLEAYSGTVTNNDYAFVTGIDDDGNAFYDRYKATVVSGDVSWSKEYRLNNSSFTAEQWAAINSGATSSKLLPSVSAIDNGKYLQVVNGVWTATELPLYNGEVE